MEEQIYRGHHEKITRVVKQVNSTNLYIYIHRLIQSGLCAVMGEGRGGNRGVEYREREGWARS